MRTDLVALRARKLIAALGSAPTRRALARGVAPSIEHAAAFRRRRFATVIDVGANRGQFMLFAQHWLQAGAIHAFEPLAVPFAMLRELADGHPGIALHRSAIGSRAHSGPIYVADRDDSSSFLRQTARQERIFGTSIARQEQVDVAPLDHFLGAAQIARPSLLKIDVQGAEADVLDGCVSLLPAIDVVYVECSFVALYEGQKLAGDIVAMLNANGFALAGIFNQAAGEEGPVQADFLFARAGAD